MIRQRTLKNCIHATGVGLHSGHRVHMSLYPAAPNTGIVFTRKDLEPNVDVPARTDFVGQTVLATTLQRDQHRVATVEHLLAAFAGLGIDNVRVELSTDEVPIMDGSAAPFVFLIQSAGIQEQTVAKRFVRICRRVEVCDGDKWARIEPHVGFRADCTIDFPHPQLHDGNCYRRFDFSTTSFIKEVSRARTFGFLRDIEHLRTRGLTLGGSLRNAVVLDEYRVINENGLRYDDELVRHKILDVIGDLYLIGHSLLGAYSSFMPGHDLNFRLIQAVLSDARNFETLAFDDPEQLPISFLQPAQSDALA